MPNAGHITINASGLTSRVGNGSSDIGDLIPSVVTTPLTIHNPCERIAAQQVPLEAYEPEHRPPLYIDASHFVIKWCYEPCRPSRSAQ